MNLPSVTDQHHPRTPRGSRRFAFGLLAYLILTVLVFEFVQRYALRVTRLYGYDIQNVGVQFGLYFVLFAGFTLFVTVAAARSPVPMSRENQLRLSFALAAALSLAAAVYQSRFGALKLVNYFVVGTMGSFAGALAVTLRQFRLVEVVGRPPRAIVDEVVAAHRGVVPASTSWDRAKRGGELVVSVLAIVVSLPISIPLAMAIWLQDPGPLLVAKVAVRRAGYSFQQLKLRTMVKNAEAATGPVPAEPDDRRVTALGGLLRRTHIDELPQMVNIALGDMSFVGPRPERTVFVQRHLRTVPNYALRHRVRPGLAGLAQVYGDYYSTPAQKLRFDLLYIRRRGPGLDLRVFWAAVMMALLGVRPGRGRRRAHGDDRARWRSAYAALRGEPAPDGSGEPEPGAPDAEGEPL